MGPGTCRVENSRQGTIRRPPYPLPSKTAIRPGFSYCARPYDSRKQIVQRKRFFISVIQVSIAP